MEKNYKLDVLHMISPKPIVDPISVVVPYYKNREGLVYTLTMLQNQIKFPDQIILIDTSPDKSGLSIAMQYSYNEIPLYVEYTPNTHIYRAWNKGIKLAVEKMPRTHVLVINDDLLIPQTLISTLKYAAAVNEALAYVPETVSRTHVSRTHRGVFKPQGRSHIQFVETKWLVGFCYMLTSDCIKQVGYFNEDKFQIWFGDTDYEKRILEKGLIQQVKGMYVYHFGGSSYAYQRDDVQKVISKDRAAFSGEEPVSSFTSEKTTPPPSVETKKPKKTFRCKKCGRDFTHQLTLARHSKKCKR